MALPRIQTRPRIWKVETRLFPARLKLPSGPAPRPSSVGGTSWLLQGVTPQMQLKMDPMESILGATVSGTHPAQELSGPAVDSATERSKAQ